MDRCSIPIREVSILWSYIDILLLPSGGYQTDFFSELYLGSQVPGEAPSDGSLFFIQMAMSSLSPPGTFLFIFI